MWRRVAVFVLGAFMSVLDTTIVNVALRSIEHGLHSSQANVQRVVTGYVLALGATIPIAAASRAIALVGRALPAIRFDAVARQSARVRS